MCQREVVKTRKKLNFMKIVRFSAIFFTALALAPALAHLFELPNKMTLSRDEYFIVQQIYRGSALLGFVVVGALLSTGMAPSTGAPFGSSAKSQRSL